MLIRNGGTDFRMLNTLLGTTSKLCRKTKLSLYTEIIRPTMSYDIPLFSGTSSSSSTTRSEVKEWFLPWRLCNCTVDPHDLLIVFDVYFLFTNFSIPEAVAIIPDLLSRGDKSVFCCRVNFTDKVLSFLGSFHYLHLYGSLWGSVQGLVPLCWWYIYYLTSWKRLSSNIFWSSQ